MNYLRALWAALRGKSPSLASLAYVAQLEARVARADRRAEGQRQSRAKRALATTDTQP